MAHAMNSFKRLVYLSTATVFLLLGPFLLGYHYPTIRDASVSLLSATSKSGSLRTFHLLLPATGSNLNFCKLLLSAGITGYPEPIFVGWSGRGIFNGSESHLFKITETLAYLRSLPASADDDLVLVLDAYDIWLQLRPEVLLSRYYNVLAENDRRLQDQGILGAFHGDSQVRVRNSIVFGPDKIHWPQGDAEPAVWAVPESSLSPTAFGPDTDSDMFTARPRWLNSGTILGPVGDMRDMFSATVDMLSRKFDSEYEFRTSDQYYFAEVWGEQEITRMKMRYGENFTAAEVGYNGHGKVPIISEGKRTEFHICLDYETEIFQTAAAYDRHLTWMRFNGTTASEADKLAAQAGLRETERIDEWTLPQDILDTEAPYANIADKFQVEGKLGWSEVPLGTNIITQLAFPLFHVTGDKSLRDRWWPRMWYHPHSEQLLKAAKRKQASLEDPAVFATVNGVRWRAARPNGVDASLGVGAGMDGKGGAWTDSGEYETWESMCGAFEEDDRLFVKHRTEESNEELIAAEERANAAEANGPPAGEIKEAVPQR